MQRSNEEKNTPFEKTALKPGTLLSPVPAVMVSCGRDEEKNILTIAWTGIINSQPPMTYISVRKSRHSHGIISREREFVINLTTEELAFAADWCGVKSGADTDKFKEMKLTPLNCSEVSCPMIAESPINLECKVREIHEYPTHDTRMSSPRQKNFYLFSNLKWRFLLGLSCASRFCSALRKALNLCLSSGKTHANTWLPILQ